MIALYWCALIGVRSCIAKNNKTQPLLISRHLRLPEISYCVIKCHELQKKGGAHAPPLSKV